MVMHDARICVRGLGGEGRWVGLLLNNCDPVECSFGKKACWLMAVGLRAGGPEISLPRRRACCSFVRHQAFVTHH